MSDTDGGRELEELQELEKRLDAAFAATRPRPQFEAELRERIRRRRPPVPWWERVGAGPLAGAAAALLLVAGFGYLLLNAGHGGGASGSSAARPQDRGAAAPAAASFGTLPRPQLPATASAPAAGGRELAPAPAGLPGSAPVYRYAEPPPADADGFASSHGARPTTVASAARLYQGAGFTLTVLPTNAAEGIQPSFVLTPQGREPEGSGPAAGDAEAAARRFLDQQHLQAPEPARVEATVAPNLPTVVRFVPQLNGADLLTTAGTPAGLAVVVKADGSVFQASGPLPLSLQPALYPLAPYAQLAQQAGPGYDHAVLVYVLAFEGGYGYLEPAVLFTGPGGRRLVPAVAPSSLR